VIVFCDRRVTARPALELAGRAVQPCGQPPVIGVVTLSKWLWLRPSAVTVVLSHIPSVSS
jgi:hypothetical protein